MRERRSWARSIDKLVADAERRPSLYRQYRPLARTEVVRAVRPSMLAIADLLRDARQPISRAAIRELDELMTDGHASPLYGEHKTRAAFVADRLRAGFTGQADLVDGWHPVPSAIR